MAAVPRLVAVEGGSEGRTLPSYDLHSDQLLMSRYSLKEYDCRVEAGK